MQERCGKRAAEFLQQLGPVRSQILRGTDNGQLRKSLQLHLNGCIYFEITNQFPTWRTAIQIDELFDLNENR